MSIPILFSTIILNDTTTLKEYLNHFSNLQVMIYILITSIFSYLYKGLHKVVKVNCYAHTYITLCGKIDQRPVTT